jgi:hypothetical protein
MNAVTRSAIAALALIIGMSGCNLLSVDYKLYPGPELPKNEIAQLSVMPFHQSFSEGWREYDYKVRIEHIFGLESGGRLNFEPQTDRNFLLPPGSYKVYVLLYIIGNHGEISRSATLNLSFKAEAGCTYHVMYDKSKEKEKRGLPDLAWIEDVQTKRVVSEKVHFPEPQ